jgi:large subunit ribosomal protein L22
MKAFLSNYRQAPRKVRLVAKALVGKSVKEAEMELRFMVKRAALPIEKLLASAVANAVNQSGLSAENLIIKEIRVDKGTVLHRSMPRAFGRASAIKKRNSHVTILLAEKAEKAPKHRKGLPKPVAVKAKAAAAPKAKAAAPKKEVKVAKKASPKKK